MSLQLNNKNKNKTQIFALHTVSHVWTGDSKHRYYRQPLFSHVYAVYAFKRPAMLLSIPDRYMLCISINVFRSPVRWTKRGIRIEQTHLMSHGVYKLFLHHADDNPDRKHVYTQEYFGRGVTWDMGTFSANDLWTRSHLYDRGGMTYMHGAAGRTSFEYL